MPQPPGWYVPPMFYYYIGDASASQDFTRGINVAVGVDTRMPMLFVIPTFVPTQSSSADVHHSLWPSEAVPLALRELRRRDKSTPLMRPAGECIGCHTDEREGPTFAVAGTVFPTPHEPDDYNGVPESSGATVVLTDANGAVHSAGLEDAACAYPYQAKVLLQGRGG